MRLNLVPLLIALAAPFIGGAAPLPAQERAPEPQPPQAQAQAPTHPITLIDAIKLGRQRGVNAALAQLNVRTANARVGITRAALLPTIQGTAGATHQTLNLSQFGIPGFTGVTPAFTVWQFQLSASQTLLDPAAIVRLRAARDTAAAAGLDAQAVGELAGATSGLAYLRVLSARETVRAREADSVIAAELLDQARQLVAAGVSPSIDQTRSEVSFGAVRTQLEVARNALDRGQLDLLRTLDLPPGTELQLADTLGIEAVNIPLDPAEAGRYAREHRAELQAEHTRTEVARGSLKAIRFENYPSLGVTGYYQQAATNLSQLAGSYAIQVGLTVPILNGFGRQNQAKEQQARLEAQELRERDLGNQVETEARQSVLDVASARQQVRIAEDRLRLAEQELQQAQDRFQAGVAGSVETTNAQSSVIAARDALIQARVNYGTARVTAYRALGIIDQLQ
jgi:outer membrane protein TolC